MKKPMPVSRRAWAYGSKFQRTDTAAIAWADGYRAAMKDVRKKIRLSEDEGFGPSALYEVKQFVNDTERLK